MAVSSRRRRAGFGADLQRLKRGARGQAFSSPRVIGQKKQFYDTSIPFYTHLVVYMLGEFIRIDIFFRSYSSSGE
jgi:hypothetical protein